MGILNRFTWGRVRPINLIALCGKVTGAVDMGQAEPPRWWETEAQDIQEEAETSSALRREGRNYYLQLPDQRLQRGWSQTLLRGAQQ